jgi:hypothetical protein
LLILILTLTNAVPQVNNEYISSPSNIPQFDFKQTSSIRKGESGEISFTLENRYAFDLENVTLSININKLVTKTTSEDIDDVPNAPTVTSGSGGDMNPILDDQTIKFQWTILKNNTLSPVKFTISTSTKTPDGTYFIRMNLAFEYRSQIYIMKSRGHFTQDEWNNADLSAKPTDPGEINLTVLGVHGIIPDTSFRVDQYEVSSFWTFLFNLLLSIGVFLFFIVVMMVIIIFVVYKFLKKT